MVTNINNKYVMINRTECVTIDEYNKTDFSRPIHIFDYINNLTRSDYELIEEHFKKYE
jgi:hypothetical protein